MRKVNGYLELSKLNLEITEASRKELEVALSISLRKWEDCLRQVKKLQQYEPSFSGRRYADRGESSRVTLKAMPYRTLSYPEN